VLLDLPVVTSASVPTTEAPRRDELKRSPGADARWPLSRVALKQSCVVPRDRPSHPSPSTMILVTLVSISVVVTNTRLRIAYFRRRPSFT